MSRNLVVDQPASFRLHLENVFEKDISMLTELIAAIDDPRIDIDLDIGYVHLHDDHGETDEHLPLGNGTIPLDEILSALNQYSPNAY